MGVEGPQERIKDGKEKIEILPVSAVGRPWRDFVHIHLGLDQQHTLVRVHGGVRWLGKRPERVQFQGFFCFADERETANVLLLTAMQIRMVVSLTRR